MKKLQNETVSGKWIPDVDDKRYRERVRLRGYTGPANILMSGDGSLTRRMFPSWSKQDHLDAARYHAYAADRDATWHGQEMADAYEKYGESGPLISGVGQDHFPEEVKNSLRFLAQRGSAHTSAAYAHWKAAGKRTRYDASLLGVDDPSYSYSKPPRRNSRSRRNARRSMTYGVLPSYDEFTDAFYEVVEGSRFSFGNDPRVGTDSLSAKELWAELQRAVNEYETNNDDDEADAAGSWASDVLGVLGFEWI
mgnify:CR=1 FL=1